VTRRPVLVVLLAILALPPFVSRAKEAPVHSNYEYHVTGDGAFGLYKPKGWKVGTQRYPNGRMVFLTDPNDLSHVNLIFLESVDPKLDSVAFAGATLKNVSARMPGMKLLEARTDRDRRRTVVKYRRKGPKNVSIEGKYCFNVTRPTALVFGYEAPADRFKESVPTLLTILQNISLLDEKAFLADLSRGKSGGPSLLPMKSASAPDGTCSLLVPDGWKLAAGKGAALCTSTDGDTGFIFTLVDFVGRSRIPYFSSSAIPGNLRAEYTAPADAFLMAMKHYGSTDLKVIERYPNPAASGMAAASLNRTVDAEIAVVSSTSRNGVPCIGYYEIVGLRPSNAGQWGIIVTGIWAPRSRFARVLPSLVKMAESFRIDQRWASEYVRQGMANLRSLMQKTSSMMARYSEEMRQSSLAAHQNRMRSMDYTSYKFSTYMRGEQEWVTGLEGGKIYSTDHWGLSSGGQTLIEGPPFNYYNYRGESLGHIPVDASREVFEAVKGR
jgi:hypothetical protein